MRKIILLLFMVCAQILTAQTNNYKITYKQFLSYGQKLQRDAVLYIKENEPTVMHSPMASTVELEKVEVPKIDEKDYAPGAVVMRITSNEKFSYSVFPDSYIKVDQQNNKNTTIDYIGLKRGFIVTDNNLEYDWKITSETKKIQNYTCYKAITSFRGNNFEAWFTPDIPLSAGPWKWYGLPGLIIEAYDVEKKNVFLLEKVEKLTQEITFPTKDFKELSLKEFIIQKDDFFTTPALTTDRNVQTTTNYKRGGLEKIFEWEEK